MSEKGNAMIYGFGTGLENPFSYVGILSCTGFWTRRTHVFSNFERAIDHFFLVRLKLKRKAENSGFGQTSQSFTEESFRDWSS